MGRWITVLFAAHGVPDVAEMVDDDEGCPVCDHPFGNLKHACISSIGAAQPSIDLPIRLPEAVVA